jgi:hypothetical protein
VARNTGSINALFAAWPFGLRRDSAQREAQEMRANFNDSEESEMANLRGKAAYRAVLARMLAWAALVVCSSASPALAQNTIAGNFTLKEDARVGSTLLAAGPYKFTVEPIGTIQSMQSIEQGAGHLVLVVMRPKESGPIASIFAMASSSGHTREASELILGTEKAGTLLQTMHLEKEGLIVDFVWSNPKAKEKLVAQKTVPVQTEGAVQGN